MYRVQIPYSNIIGNFNQDTTIGSTGSTYIGRIRDSGESSLPADCKKLAWNTITGEIVYY
jgi:hypothetical protein